MQTDPSTPATVPISRLFSPMNRAANAFAGCSYRMAGRELLGHTVVEHGDAIGHGQSLSA